MYNLLYSLYKTSPRMPYNKSQQVALANTKTYFGRQQNLFCRYKPLQESTFIQSY